VKFSLKNIIENKNERDPSIASSEAHRFLIFLQNNNGYGYHPRAQKHIFSEYNKNGAEEFINELISEGWIKKDYINQLDLGIFVTEKALSHLRENFDYLSETKKLITLLQSEKMNSVASIIQIGLSSASNSTELLISLKFNLEQIPHNSVSKETLLQIETMIKEIEIILKR
jgi:hypothetical protein